MPSHRKSASSVDEMIENLEPAQRAIVTALRALVKQADPAASEGFKWSMPVFEHDGMLCYIAPMKSSVNFGFYESAPVLDDADGLLEGTGKRMRHVKLASASEIRTTLFAKWVKQAAAFNAQQKGAKGASRETSSNRASSSTRGKISSRSTIASRERSADRSTSSTSRSAKSRRTKP